MRERYATFRSYRSSFWGNPPLFCRVETRHYPSTLHFLLGFFRCCGIYRLPPNVIPAFSHTEFLFDPVFFGDFFRAWSALSATCHPAISGKLFFGLFEVIRERSLCLSLVCFFTVCMGHPACRFLLTFPVLLASGTFPRWLAVLRRVFPFSDPSLAAFLNFYVLHLRDFFYVCVPL